ncbi:MAG: hypothetical protein AAGA86_04135, partial [Bacteroidota bacterium]
MTIWELIFLCFAFQGILMATFLVLRKGSSRYANTIWALFLFLFSLNLIYNVLYWAFYNAEVTVALNFVYMVPFSAYGPLFFLYVKALTQKKSMSAKEIAYHFIPTLLVILNFSYYFSLPVATKNALGDQLG